MLPYDAAIVLDGLQSSSSFGIFLPVSSPAASSSAAAAALLLLKEISSSELNADDNNNASSSLTVVLPPPFMAAVAAFISGIIFCYIVGGYIAVGYTPVVERGGNRL